MSQCLKISDIANEIFIELGEPSSISIPFLASWLRGNIGKLNNLIDTCFVIDENFEISPPMDINEVAILKEMYYIKYFENLATNSLAAASDWSEVSEGDTTIRKTNRNEIAKTYTDLRKESAKTLDYLIRYYRQNKSKPNQVTGDDHVVNIGSPYTRQGQLGIGDRIYFNNY